MTVAHATLLLAACASDPVVNEARGSSAAQAMDPLLDLAWTAESDQADAYFGASVSSAGDVNGDGYGDVIVGAQWYSGPESNEGRAYGYLGSPAGLDPTATWTSDSDQIYANFGYSVSSAGDVNGDGYGDVVVGAPFYAEVGRAYVFLGSAAGLDPTAAWTAESDQSVGMFGGSVSSAGDVNGDGYDDVIVGARQYSHPESYEGLAYVYLGSTAAHDRTPEWSAESDQSGAFLGHSVSSAGDVDGDGYGDVIVGAPGWYDYDEFGEGRAYVFFGSAAGLDPTPDWTVESDQGGAEFGTAVSSAGDVNGDGHGDVIVGADHYENRSTNVGRTYVFLGSAAGLDPAAAWTAECDQQYSGFGHSVSSAGDVNGDGYGDVVIGADSYSNESTWEGRTYVYLGSATSIDSTPRWTAEPNQDKAFFGDFVSAAGDVNGDGYGDVVVGASGYDNGSMDEGRAFLFEGGCHDIVDSDADSIGDACDVCPGDPDPGQEDDDADGIGAACDCDDSNPASYPGAPELCDGADNNCDGLLPANEIDADGDLYSACEGDCDDAEPRANSDPIEVCGDAIDNNCDGVVDEGCAEDTGDPGCACNGAGGAGAPSLFALAVLLRAARRRS